MKGNLEAGGDFLMFRNQGHQVSHENERKALVWFSSLRNRRGIVLETLRNFFFTLGVVALVLWRRFG